ncbi:hypothetical protein PVK06_005070 [Gossypium arboreum]|uniref:Uncharacterized protein n=1 Tax=Gossypium arboreum TaxID=29729 RepID=A0ABR0QUY9_GOSAR|nr:hypothetical protein PVK06_005070 [Gossypium arboreum]
MAKPIPKVGSHVRGWVISWSSAGTCGFNDTRRGTPFAAQTAARNAIRPILDQCMQQVEVMIKGSGLGRDTALKAIRRSEIVLRGNLYGTRNAFICAKGPRYVTAQDIILPPFVEILDNTQ